MLAIAGGVVWGGYLLLVYGLSQLAGQNYSISMLAIPGKFTLGTPAPDVPGSGGGGSGPKQTTSPCTKAQTKAGWVASSQGGCVPPQQVTKSPCTKAQLAKGWVKTENGKCAPPNPNVTQSPPPGM
jgi:hypothetical protein